MPNRYPNISESTTRDHKLAGATIKALGESADVDIRDIKVDALRGTVRLTGVVNTLFEKRRAGVIASNIEGVERVQNNLVISPTNTPDDDELYECLDRALGGFPEWDPTAVGIRKVCDGIAYIAGNVTSVDERLQAGKIAQSVPGIKQVVNEIDIAVGEPLDDVTIQTFVSDEISNDARIDPFDIHVGVEHGHVTLEGEVEDAEAVSAAAERASAAPGVKGVKNHLTARD